MSAEWQPIETAPHGKALLLYQPATGFVRGRKGPTLPARIVIESWPTGYPRETTHWMPLPEPPANSHHPTAQS